MDIMVAVSLVGSPLVFVSKNPLKSYMGGETTRFNINYTCIKKWPHTPAISIVIIAFVIHATIHAQWDFVITSVRSSQET